MFLEVGPGRTLTNLVKRHSDTQSDQIILPSLRHPQDSGSDQAVLLNTLGALWLSGVLVDWAGFHRHQQRQRIPLPTYPFERQRYWIDPPQPGDRALPKSSGKQANIADWFYLPSWKPSIPPQVQADRLESSVDLVFIDDGASLAEGLVKQLEQQNPTVILVKTGAEFAQLNDRLYTLNPQSSDDYHTLVNTLLNQHKRLQNIVHLWTLSPTSDTTDRSAPEDRDAIEQAQISGFYSLLFLAQALGKQTGFNTVDNKVQITVISNYLHPVMGTEPLSPEKAMLLGPIRVIPQEYPHIRCRSIEVVSPVSDSWQERRLINQVLDELSAPITQSVIAYRGHQRYVQTVESVRLDQPLEARSRLRQNGVYLITGGLGHIGLILARYLAETVQAKLILLGRSALPARRDWETWLIAHEESHPIHQKIRQVQELEALGAEILVISADVVDQAQMRAAIAQSEAQFGPINGVIHAAGVVGEKAFKPIAQIDKAHCEQQFRPKVQGLLGLETVLQGKPLDFCLSVSSLSSILGGLEYASYAAANLFIDTFIHQHNQVSPIPWVSVNWDAWDRFEGGKEIPPVGSNLAQFLIKPTEGVDAFQRILGYENLSQIIVSTGDLNLRMNQWLQPNTGEQKSDLKSPQLHSRPTLKAAYAAPEHEIEKTLVDIFQQLLGIEPIGVHDNFFDLGGDSMMGIQLISKIRSHFQIELSIHHVFAAPCIADLALKIEEILIEEILLEKLET